MPDFPILKLQGPLQAWGRHTYEEYRPTHLFPTRSGILGLLGACLGIDRADTSAQQRLSDSFLFAVRVDTREFKPHVIEDLHTVLDAPKVDGSINKYSVPTIREYICDACFTVGMQFNKGASFNQGDIIKALKHPYYTPVLGRRSCPLSRPLFEAVVNANDLHQAIRAVEPQAGVIYSEIDGEAANTLVIRDVPSFSGRRQFQNRTVYIYGS
jgi:CRISPR system Cascade subunit CasD